MIEDTIHSAVRYGGAGIGHARQGHDQSFQPRGDCSQDAGSGIHLANPDPPNNFQVDVIKEAYSRAASSVPINPSSAARE